MNLVNYFRHPLEPSWKHQRTALQQHFSSQRPQYP